MPQPSAIHVQGFEDFVNGFGRDSSANGPEDNVQVFLAGLELIEDVVEECVLFDELALQQTEVTLIEFHPEDLPLQMFDPPCPEITRPVPFHPVSDTLFAQVATRFLALNPLMAIFVLAAIVMNAPRANRSEPVVGL